MLVRMARYLWRHRSSLPVAFTRTDMLRFLRALGIDGPALEERFDSLRRQLERALKRRDLIP